MDWEKPSDVLKALLFLYSLQTAEERSSKLTVELNGIGFNGAEAPFLSSISEQILYAGKGISKKQFEIVKHLVQGHPKQLEYLDLNSIELPITAVIYDASRPSEADGLLKLNGKMLEFHPYIFPTKQIKEAAGFSGDKTPEGKFFWKNQVSMNAINKVKELFPKTLLDGSVETWIKEQYKPNPIIEAMRSAGAFAFQQEVAGFSVEKKRTFIALDPGLGKSMIAIFAAKILGGKTLIISPLALLRNWRSQIKKWVGEDSQIWHQSLGISSDWVITNYESILTLWSDHDEVVTTDPKTGKKKKELLNWQCIVDHDFDTVIIDESILIKNRKAQRSNAVFQLAQTAKNLFLLSGNPSSRFLDDMFFQLKTIRPKQFTSYWKFAKEYCIVVQTQWGWQIQGNQPDGIERLKRNIGDFYISRSQSQVLDIPDWIIDPLEIEMKPDQYKLYDEMEKTFKATLPDGDQIVSKNVLSQLIRLTQFASNPVLVGGPNSSGKWEVIEELLEYEKPKYIIWTAFIKTAQMMLENLGKKKYMVAALTGETPEANRQKIVDNFQEGPLDIIVAHPGVGKFGFTLTAAHTAIYLERGYSGDYNYQSLHRIKRIGTTESPHVIPLISCRPNGNPVSTVDHVIHKILKYRLDNSKAITTGEIRQYFEEIGYE